MAVIVRVLILRGWSWTGSSMYMMSEWGSLQGMIGYGLSVGRDYVAYAVVQAENVSGPASETKPDCAVLADELIFSGTSCIRAGVSCVASRDESSVTQRKECPPWRGSGSRSINELSAA